MFYFAQWKIAMCQMEVVPGNPVVNMEKLLQEIEKARQDGVEIFIAPEMCVPGYLIGDTFEDDAFALEVQKCNDIIIAASLGIVVIFGTLEVDTSSLSYPNREENPDIGYGEDGRILKSNAVCLAVDGKGVFISKTLQPNYRIFNDDRHFYSTRKLAEENGVDVECLLKVQDVHLNEKRLRLGLMVCEDMWCDDYFCSPARILTGKGAELLINVSCSPWGWQKNRKRHQVAGDLCRSTRVPMIYVNNAGVQNTGKNIVTFDGSSTVYDAEGKVRMEVGPYRKGTFYFQDGDVEEARSDVEELYAALIEGIRGFYADMPEKMRKAVIGLSGGIDSAVSLALLTKVLGEQNVMAVNLPSRYNSAETKDLAKRIAMNFGVEYLVHPIEVAVNAIARELGIKPLTPAYENLQARERGNFIATLAQKNGATFPCNANKIETAFGYGTLYGDLSGALSILGDCTKQEVRQVADYANKLAGRELIPYECINQPPKAELGLDKCDPFDYGTLTERGYHDEMVRAFVCFRKNPEWFLEKYLDGTLESEMKLPEGKLKKLFLTAEDFVKDLEHKWNALNLHVFKRVQVPPIIIVSKRAFGTDLREYLGKAYYTMRYHELKLEILK